MYTVALRDEIRTWVLIQCKSQRAATRHFGLSRNTVAKLLALSQWPTVLAEMGGRLGSWTTCRANSARLQRESGTWHCLGKLQAMAVTWART